MTVVCGCAPPQSMTGVRLYQFIGAEQRWCERGRDCVLHLNVQREPDDTTPVRTPSRCISSPVIGKAAKATPTMNCQCHVCRTTSRGKKRRGLSYAPPSRTWSSMPVRHGAAPALPRICLVAPDLTCCVRLGGHSLVANDELRTPGGLSPKCATEHTEQRSDSGACTAWSLRQHAGHISHPSAFGRSTPASCSWRARRSRV